MIAAFTPRAIVKLAAIRLGVRIPDDVECDIILWEYTSFPGRISSWLPEVLDVLHSESISKELSYQGVRSPAGIPPGTLTG